MYLYFNRQESDKIHTDYDEDDGKTKCVAVDYDDDDGKTIVMVLMIMMTTTMMTSEQILLEEFPPSHENIPDFQSRSLNVSSNAGRGSIVRPLALLVIVICGCVVTASSGDVKEPPVITTVPSS